MKYKNTPITQHQLPAKTGILLVNLGTPQAATKQALKPYLKQFLSDPRVVEVPRLIWYLVLNLIILPFRSKRSAEAYQQVWTEQGSPLLLNTRAITEEIKQKLDNKTLVVDFAMRYGQPSVEDKIDALLAEAGSERNKLLSITIYVRDMKDFAAMNAVYDAWVADIEKPARACVEARMARPDVLVEFSVIAAQ